MGGRGRGGWNVSGLLLLVIPPGQTTHMYIDTNTLTQTHAAILAQALRQLLIKSKRVSMRLVLELDQTPDVQNVDQSQAPFLHQCLVCCEYVASKLPVQTGNAFFGVCYKVCTLVCDVCVCVGTDRQVKVS